MPLLAVVSCSRWLILIYILLILDVIAAPLLIAGFLYRNRRRIADKDKAFSQRFGLLFEVSSAFAASVCSVVLVAFARFPA